MLIQFSADPASPPPAPRRCYAQPWDRPHRAPAAFVLAELDDGSTGLVVAPAAKRALGAAARWMAVIAIGIGLAVIAIGVIRFAHLAHPVLA